MMKRRSRKDVRYQGAVLIGIDAEIRTADNVPYMHPELVVVVGGKWTEPQARSVPRGKR